MRAEPKKTTLKHVTGNLDSILQKRNGRAINFRGIYFQVVYACYLIIQKQNPYN